MGKYGKAATDAAKLLARNNSKTPREAWNLATMSVFSDSPSSQSKGCPRDTFLALCQLGEIPDVPQGNYTRSKKNKEYVERALAALRSNPELLHDEQSLWAIAVENSDKTHNSQMDVLTTLFRDGFID